MGCPLGPDVEPAAKKTSSRYGLPTLFQPGLPSLGSPHCAHNKPMWASSWAAHLGLTWSPRPKKHPADMGCLHCSNLGCPAWAALIVPMKNPGVLVHGLPTWAGRGPRAKKTSSRYGLPTLFQPGLPSLGSPHCAHKKPMCASSWAAHLGLTWSPRPKKHPADMGCLHCSNLGCPAWAALIVPMKSPCGLVHGLTTWA